MFSRPQFSDHEAALAHGLGERLARFARALTVLLVILATFELVISYLEKEPSRLFTTSGGGAQLSLVVVAAATWSFARRATILAVRLLDGFFISAVGAAVAAALWGFPTADAPHLLGLLLITLVLLGRSALIPSSATTTMLVGVLAFCPTVLATIAGFGAPHAQLDAGIRVGFVCTWSAGAVAVATVCSHIVYDLRLQVISALRLGPYRLGRRLGQGGVGEVFEARHARLRRPAAIKLLRRGVISDEALARFEQEVQITSTLRHPNTVSIYDFGRTATGEFFYVMELLEGMSLHELVQYQGPLSASRAVFILRQLVDALAEAHDRGLVHRDIKPANIMVGNRAGLGDFVKVVDFGLAHPVADVRTATHIMGTPQFLAPEAISGDAPVDAATDIYAVGVTAYFALTGVHPFSGNNIAEVCAGHLYEEPVPPSGRSNQIVDPGFERIVMRCLAKNPEVRIRTASELRTALMRMEVASPWSFEQGRQWWECHAPHRFALDDPKLCDSGPEADLVPQTLLPLPLAPTLPDRASVDAEKTTATGGAMKRGKMLAVSNARPGICGGGEGK